MCRFFLSTGTAPHTLLSALKALSARFGFRLRRTYGASLLRPATSSLRASPDFHPALGGLSSGLRPTFIRASPDFHPGFARLSSGLRPTFIRASPDFHPAFGGLSSRLWRTFIPPLADFHPGFGRYMSGTSADIHVIRRPTYCQYVGRRIASTSADVRKVCYTVGQSCEGRCLQERKEASPLSSFVMHRLLFQRRMVYA